MLLSGSATTEQDDFVLLSSEDITSIQSTQAVSAKYDLIRDMKVSLRSEENIR